MVSATSTFKWFVFSVRVNRLEFQEVALRPCGEQPTDFEVVIRDCVLGEFALHKEFLLEIREAQRCNARWRAVSLEELQDAIGKEMQVADPNFDARTRLGSIPSADLQRSPRCRIERIPIDGDSSHLDRLRGPLLTARIRYPIVGGLDSRGRAAGHLTVAVSCLPRAGMCLRRAGFLESPESKYVLIDSRTGWKVRLLEGRARRSRLSRNELKPQRN
jgi:hypothetical protein